jgi:hypothetical protein
MTEAEARAVLRAYVAVGGIERWLAEQSWEQLAGSGWRVLGQLHDRWRFLLEPVAGGGVRVFMYADEPPATWVVPAR